METFKKIIKYECKYGMIIFLLFLFPQWSYSQVKLNGKVVDKVAPISGANVVLKNLNGVFVTGAVTQSDGSFVIKVNDGSYKVAISFLGFRGWEKEILLEKDTSLGTIVLEEDGGNLKEISIVSRKPVLEQKSDRIVFHVENSIAAIGGAAVDVLRVAPGLVILNKNISMLGRGSSRIMVDGRIIELTGEDLFNYLNSIASGDIASLEIITNPPAQYEAGGDGGLINIKLKKGVRDSWKNSTTLAYDQNKYSSFTLRNNFLYNKNKLKFSFSGGGSVGNNNLIQDLITYYPDGQSKLNYEGKQKQDKVSGRIALDYDISAHTSIGFQYLGDYNYPGSKDRTVIEFLNSKSRVDSLINNSGFRDLSSESHAYNAHLMSELDTLHRRISFDFDYFSYDSKTDNSFVANAFLPNMEFLNTNLSARNVSDQNINNYSVKVDMEHPLSFLNLSYGVKVSHINSSSDIQYYNTMMEVPVLDPGKSDAFLYKESNQAVYINGIKTINKKLSVQLGFRLENTATNGHSSTLNQTTDNKYLKLFPTFYFSYKKNEDHSFLFNYGKRINRPNFGILNPFRSYINSNSYSEGNPFLQPSFSDNFEITHVYKGKFRTNAFLNITNDGFGVVFNSRPDSKTQIITRENYFKEFYYGIGENLSTNIASWWQNQNSLYILGSQSKFASTINAIPKNGVQFYLTTNHTFSLSEFTKLQVDYFYSSAVKRGLYEYGSMSGLNIAVKQNVLKKNMQLSLLLNDVFNTAYLKDYTSVVNGIKQVYVENNSSRFFRLSLTYNFGNNKIKVKEREFGNDEERERSN